MDVRQWVDVRQWDLVRDLTVRCVVAPIRRPAFGRVIHPTTRPTVGRVVP